MRYLIFVSMNIISFEGLKVSKKDFDKDKYFFLAQPLTAGLRIKNRP